MDRSCTLISHPVACNGTPTTEAIQMKFNSNTCSIKFLGRTSCLHSSKHKRSTKMNIFVRRVTEIVAESYRIAFCKQCRQRADLGINRRIFNIIEKHMAEKQFVFIQRQDKIFVINSN